MKQKFQLADIHYPNFEQEVALRIENDIRRMTALFSNEFIDTVCPACLSDRRTLYETNLGLNYQHCDKCGLIYVSPCPTEDIKLWYFKSSEGLRYWRENMPTHVRDRRKALLYADRARFVAQQTKKFGVIPELLIEIGAGSGEMAEELLASIDIGKIILIEPQPLQLRLPKVEVINTTLENFQTSTPADVVLAFEVLEHIIDPDHFLKMIFQLLAPDGIFLLSTPNAKGLEIAELKTLSTALRFDHIRIYNPRSLQVLLERNGFQMLEIDTPGELDVEIIHNEYKKGTIDLSDKPALKFLMEGDYAQRMGFQEFLKTNNMSSHMKCLARKAKT